MTFVSYKVHKEIFTLDTYINDFLQKEGWWTYRDYLLKETNTTFLTFNQWVALYHADPEGWKFCKIGDHFVLPTYFKINKEYLRDNSNPQFIKFLTRKDYRKWCKFLKQEEKSGQDNENIKEYQSLLASAQKMADKRLRDSQKQIQWQYVETYKLLGKNTDDIQKYFEDDVNGKNVSSV